MKDIQNSQSREQLIRTITQHLDHYIKSSSVHPETEVLKDRLRLAKHTIWQMHRELTNRGNRLQQLDMVMKRATNAIENSVNMNDMKVEMLKILNSEWLNLVNSRKIEDENFTPDRYDAIVNSFEELFLRLTVGKHEKKRPSNPHRGMDTQNQGGEVHRDRGIKSRQIRW